MKFNQTLSEDAYMLNRLFWQFTGTVTIAIAEAIAQEAASAWGTHLAGMLNPDVVLDTVTCRDLTSDTGAFGGYTSGTTGGLSGNVLAADTAMVIKWAINRHYRGGHPRWYQAGLNQVDLLDPQSWTTSIITSATTNFAAFITELTGYSTGGVTLVGPANVSYYNGFTAVKYPSGRYRNVPTVRAVPLVDPIVGVTINPKVGSQRRRSLQQR